MRRRRRGEAGRDRDRLSAGPGKRAGELGARASPAEAVTRFRRKVVTQYTAGSDIPCIGGQPKMATPPTLWQWKVISSCTRGVAHFLPPIEGSPDVYISFANIYGHCTTYERWRHSLRRTGKGYGPTVGTDPPSGGQTGGLVTVIEVKWYGSAALEITYRDCTGKLGSEISLSRPRVYPGSGHVGLALKLQGALHPTYLTMRSDAGGSHPAGDLGAQYDHG